MDDQFSELVSKVLAGEASDNEKKSLQQLLLESPEHSLMYNQLKEYWDADVKLTSTRNKNEFEAQLMAQLNFKPVAQTSKFRKFYLRMASAAAILFFVATCTLAYMYTASPRELYTYSAQSTPVEYTLADGTKVTLNKNSSLTFKSDFGDKRRDVKLLGEAFFKVSKDKTKPFAVETMGTTTEVLGTSFNVKTIQGTSNISTTLVEGSVRFISDNCETILKPGEEVIYNTTTKKFEKKKTDTQYNTAWVSGRFKYNNLSFGLLAAKLEQIYKIKIDISDQKIANRIVSASFLNDEPIEDILKALEDDLNFNYILKDANHIDIVRKTLRKELPM